MISKETLYRFLVALDKQYGNSVEYFMIHPYNEIHHKLAELQKLRDEHEMCVCWDFRAPHDIESYDISDMFDIRDRLAVAQSPEYLRIGVYTNSADPRVSLTPDSELFQKMAKLFVETDDIVAYMPTDVITIDDMSFTVHDILCAINEHAEPTRLKKHIIGDRYVKVNSEDLTIGSTECYSDEMIDKIEKVADKVLPYWDGSKQYTYPECDEYVQWDAIFNGENPVLTDDNVIYLCCNQPDYNTTRSNIPALTNFVDFICDSEDKFIGIMLIRAITQAKISVSYKDVPRFKDYVNDNALYVREIRYMQ